MIVVLVIVGSVGANRVQEFDLPLPSVFFVERRHFTVVQLV